MAWNKQIAEMIDVDSLNLHPDNPRQGDIGAIAVSIEQNGWYGTVVAQRSTNNILVGNHRLQAAKHLGIEKVPVYFVDCDDVQAKKIMLADNRTNDLATYVEDDLIKLLTEIATTNDLLGTGFDGDDLDELLLNSDLDLDDTFLDNPDIPDGVYSHNVDVFYNASPPLTKAMESAGLRAGIISSSYSQRFQTQIDAMNLKMGFVDNEFKEYDHAKHVDAVRNLRPQYATVRDIMTKTQCEQAGIEYYDINQILEMAEEVAEHADNVIIIPKYDCIDDIPEKYMLGYSIPSSYGGTPLLLERFKGRRTHLLGGNWKKQRAALHALGDSVVSLDNNHFMNIARFGMCYLVDGREVEVAGMLPEGLGRYGNLLAMVLSVSAIFTDLARMGCTVNGRKLQSKETNITTPEFEEEISTRGEDDE